MFVKVCGLRTSADVATAVAAGADAVGFVLAASPRQVTAADARRLAAGVPGSVLTVGVLAGIEAAEAARLAREAGVDAVQLHGRYPREAFAVLAAEGMRLIRATPLEEGTELTVGAYGEELLLLDSPAAGSGQRWDLGLAPHVETAGPVAAGRRAGPGQRRRGDRRRPAVGGGRVQRSGIRPRGQGSRPDPGLRRGRPRGGPTARRPPWRAPPGRMVTSRDIVAAPRRPRDRPGAR